MIYFVTKYIFPKYSNSSIDIVCTNLSSNTIITSTEISADISKFNWGKPSDELGISVEHMEYDCGDISIITFLRKLFEHVLT